MGSLLFVCGSLIIPILYAELHAQPRYAHSDFVLDQWGIEDGLPVNNVITLLQSRQGYLWMVTYDGLVRFDGIRFKNYQTESNPELPSNRLINLKEAPDESLWMETEQGFLVRFKHGSFQHIQEQDGLNGNFCESIHKGPDGRLWFASEQGISVFDGDTLTPYRPDTIHGDIDRVFAEQSGAIWYRDQTDYKIYRYHNGESTYQYTSRELEFLPFFEDDTQTVWFESGLNIYYHKQDSLHKYGSIEPASNGVTEIGQDQYGSIWLSSYQNGFYELEDNKITHFEPSTEASYIFSPFYVDSGDQFWKFTQGRIWQDHYPIFDSGDAITSFTVDHEENIWVGTRANGILRLKPNPFVTYGTQEGLPNRNIYPVIEDESGAIWAGTHGDGVVRIKNGTVNDDWTFKDLNQSVYVLSLAQLADRIIVAGLHGGGLYQRRPGSNEFIRMTEPGSPGNETVYGIYEQQNGTLWVGGQTGLYKKTENTWHLHNEDTGFTNHPVRYFLKAPDGALWMATNGAGIARYKNGTFDIYGVDDGLPSNLIRSLHIEPENGDEDYVLWIGTEDRGLLRLEVQKNTPQLQNTTIYSTNSGMLDYIIHVIMKDDTGNFWFNTNRGVFTVPHEQLEAYHRGEISTISGTSYSESDGLRNREGNGGMYPAGIRASSNHFYLPGQDGLVKFDPAKMLTNEQIPPVIIEEVTISDSILSYLTDTEVKLSRDQRDFEITYTSLSLVAPHKNEFKYRLAGYNDTWIEAGDRRSATYTNIPAGTYTFEVQGSNNTGIWNPQPAMLTIVIEPRFYETAGFRLFMVLLMIGLIYSGVKWRISALEKSEIRLRKLVDERTEQLEREKQKTQKQADRLEELNRAKSRFFTNISHEFRTPLTLIMSPLQRMLSTDQDKFDQQTTTEFERMLRNSDRLLRLIDQTLELSRFEHGIMHLHVVKISISNFLESLLELFEHICTEKELSLTFNRNTNMDEVYVDPDKLDKIIANLISNAIKFTPAGGSVTVELSETDTFLEIQVSDTGIGISPEEQTHIFDRFYQVDSSETRFHEGSGVGLSLARDFARLHHGDVLVNSETNRGSTFAVQLKKGKDHFSDEDLAIEQDDRPLPYIKTNNDIHHQKEENLNDNGENDDDQPTILLVEDNPDLRTFIHEILATTWHVTEASNGKVALDLISDNLPDLIIADIMMPEMDGVTFNQHLKKDPATASIPLIFLTAKATKQNQITGYDEGADAYITKPFDPEILKARVQNLLESRYRLRELLAKETHSDETDKNHTEPVDPFIQKVDRIISEHYNNPDFNVQQLVALLYLDRSQVLRKLKHLTGMTPGVYLKKHRMEEAARLLRTEAGSISEVAYAVGFKSLAYFSYAFKTHFEQTPSEFVESGRIEQNNDPHKLS